MKSIALFIVVNLVASSFWAEKTLAAEAKAKPGAAKQMAIAELALKKLKVHTLTVQDPNESTMTKAALNTYQAYDGTEVFNLAFGNSDWMKSKSLIFKCTDGYMPTLETKDFLNGGFYFAFKREGSPDFSIVNNSKDNKKASLAPYYLIWKEKNMQLKPRSYFWPYQIVSVSYQ